MGMSEQITVGSYPDELDAHMARAFLEREGVESFISGEHYIGIEPLHWIAMGGVRLTVDIEDVSEARTLVARHDAERFEIYESLTRTCPSCGSSEVQQPGLWRIPLIILVILTLGLLAWFIRSRRECEDCGHRW